MDYKIVLILSIMAVSCFGISNRPPKEELCACGKIYFPLCGSDGVTYDNICEFNCKAEHLWNKKRIVLQIVKEDECGAPIKVQ